MLKVNDIFHSVQGEGFYTGQLTTFIRLSGCNVKCNIKKFCDTEYNSYKEMNEDEIISKLKYKTVCITGGEPLEQNIHKLCRKLRESGRQVHIQTSGTIDIDDDLFSVTNHVVISPKLPVDKLKITRCDEIKVVYIGQNVESYYKFAGARYHYIQPVEKNGSFNTKETFEKLSEMANNDKWRFNLQSHKYIKGIK